MAYHEAGHAVTGWFLQHAEPLLKVGWCGYACGVEAVAGWGWGQPAVLAGLEAWAAAVASPVRNLRCRITCLTCPAASSHLTCPPHSLPTPTRPGVHCSPRQRGPGLCPVPAQRERADDDGAAERHDGDGAGGARRGAGHAGTHLHRRAERPGARHQDGVQPGGVAGWGGVGRGETWRGVGWRGVAKGGGCRACAWPGVCRGVRWASQRALPLTPGATAMCCCAAQRATARGRPPAARRWPSMA